MGLCLFFIKKDVLNPKPLLIELSMEHNNAFKKFFEKEESYKHLPEWLRRDIEAIIPARLLEPTGSRKTWGVLDFSAMPYALGDCLTWQVNLMCTALENKSDSIRIIVLLDPKKPSNYKLQSHINEGNYKIFFERLKDSLFCIPMKHTVQYESDRYLVFKAAFLSHQRPQLDLWPPLIHLAADQVDYMSHYTIIRFYKKYGFIPLLGEPSALPGKMALQLKKKKSTNKRIFLHLRNSINNNSAANIYRDSNPKKWVQILLHIITLTNGEVDFWYAGNPNEYFKEILAIKNVCPLRNKGLRLKDELFLMGKADAFIGSMSGFAMGAVYSKTPYVITKLEEKFQREMIGASDDHAKFPFAQNNQFLFWGPEDVVKIKNCINKILS